MRRKVYPIASSHFCYGDLKFIMTGNVNPNQSSDIVDELMMELSPIRMTVSRVQRYKLANKITLPFAQHISLLIGELGQMPSNSQPGQKPKPILRHQSKTMTNKRLI